jgi:hypothetical protein
MGRRFRNIDIEMNIGRVVERKNMNCKMEEYI